ncbi:cell differentiation protein rcd1 [Echinococcus multilocularis]|uniref:CCR4-NOT transcription complex subunit 9 n=1 Tax=Echinococcus multilocularis TaxID=6211 RepID=A0A068YF70_ECHMU|nr:cell differentiation protein rcd1 [Echinococcus multilocularis]
MQLMAGNSSKDSGGLSSGNPEVEFYTWVNNLSSLETREKALLELCKMRESLPDFAPLLWYSFGTVAALLQEITAVYPYISPPNLTAHQSNRVCNALALLQCLASHPVTRTEFLKAQIPLYLYNFLSTNSRNRPFEYLRLTSLGVIGALAKTDDPDVISFLLNTEIIPLCLHIMETGSELSKTVATFIMQKLLQDNNGLEYICHTYERFAHVATVLSSMVEQLAKEQSTRLLKHVIRCYQRLCDNSRARDALRNCLPEALRNNTFAAQLVDEPATQRCLALLVEQLARPSVTAAAAASGAPGEGIGNAGVTDVGAGGAGGTIEGTGPSVGVNASAPPSSNPPPVKSPLELGSARHLKRLTQHSSDNSMYFLICFYLRTRVRIPNL